MILNNIIQNPLSEVLHDPDEDRGAILGARFDGSNDYLEKTTDLTGNVNSKVGLIATRLRLLSGDGVSKAILYNSNGRITFYRPGNNLIYLILKNGAVGTIATVRSTNLFRVVDGWINILVAWDLGAATLQMYVNDADETDIVTNIDDTIDYTTADHSIGAYTGGTALFPGDINFLYANYAETLDISVEANRRKFFDADGKVVDMYSNGSKPTGNTPIIFQQGEFDQWQNNKGSGGGFTAVGELTRPAI